MSKAVYTYNTMYLLSFSFVERKWRDLTKNRVNKETKESES